MNSLLQAPAWLLGPNVEIPLRRLVFGVPGALVSLTIQQASAQEMMWLFTALTSQTVHVSTMSFKLCDFTLVSEMFGPLKQDLGGPSSHLLANVTDLSIVECVGIESSWYTPQKA